MRACIIGLGRMGRGMAINLVSRGHVVYGYDINKSIYAALSNAGVKTVDSVGQCGDADYVVLALPTGRESAQVLSELSTNAVIVDTTTMSLAELEQVLSIVRNRGFRYITARLEGGPKQAESGSLVMFIGGDEQLYKQSEEFLRQLGTPIYIGTHEQATLLKLISTSIIIANTMILAELSPLMKDVGLDTNTLVKALSMSGADSAQLRARLPWILSGNYPESFSIDLAKYVIDETIKHSMSKGRSLPIMTIIDKLLEIARSEGKGRGDFSEAAEILKK
ncbi:NAD(P)-dependent oxidoreductase [Vulcanisaeta distributa]|uniref:6-phosphogluconate dehydrogenase NAD-binding protein n=1 Tax=Vulcanisaeta distributa (strain DSM 14429 / JCM 11212 / NBRC 100878 / IC-017) TaxID=572478 RepID=E1QSM2_VULDI|nr:NAD(P)-dependent oxidoreductase [Vulcanisaeta distributa]ADN50815.1 6-phosphogluconate dehydrogenase NAD-binding protein [Vulcanisaeta distributa DSM 14429]